MPRRPFLIPLGCATLILAGCVGSVDNFDFRDNAIANAGVQTAPRPEPDAFGLISYENYQVVVARRGDSVADVAQRLGLTPQELAEFNGRQPADPLREGEILALPRRVGARGGAGSGTDIAAIARGAIDEAEAAQGPAAAAPAPVLQPGVEPVRHRVGRGENAYSVARLYGVSVRALAEWNRLGPDLAVREGQFLLIPIVLEGAPPAAPGAEPTLGIAGPPPSATTPLPDPIEAAPLPPLTGGGPALPTPPPPAPVAEPAVEESRLAMPVAGSIQRGYSAENEGIDISAAAGTPVRAAGDGVVAAITEDTDQIPILVVRHPDGLLTVYANIRNISVARGESVSRGQRVAEVGPGDPSFLHFEVRRGFEAVNPVDFLP